MIIKINLNLSLCKGEGEDGDTGGCELYVYPGA